MSPTVWFVIFWVLAVVMAAIIIFTWRWKEPERVWKARMALVFIDVVIALVQFPLGNGWGFFVLWLVIAAMNAVSAVLWYKEVDTHKENVVH